MMIKEVYNAPIGYKVYVYYAGALRCNMLGGCQSSEELHCLSAVYSSNKFFLIEVVVEVKFNGVCGWIFEMCCCICVYG